MAIENPLDHNFESREKEPPSDPLLMPRNLPGRAIRHGFVRLGIKKKGPFYEER